ncbi:unnamed protein product [Euphydryas editha]|uniref:Uncharacterized protein n=1 Tax=Euphydryas editha TaxID=104508 RepID=A0AAU9TDL3_EUPED|nr:unnamed protein product [Euphydryas editha]
MEDYISIVETQNEIMGAMEKLLTNFKKDSSERKTQSYIKRRLETLEAYWKEFLENHNKLEEISEKTKYPYFTENYYQQTLRFYTETKKYFEKFT